MREKYDYVLGEKWVTIEENGIQVALNIYLDDWQIAKGVESKNRRKKIMEKKKYENIKKT